MPTRLFTDAERAYAAARARPGQHLAARFCAKEAVAKALGLEAWSLRDVEVVGGRGSARSVALHGAAAERAASSGSRCDLAHPHAASEAAAVAIAGRLRMAAPAARG